MKKALINIIIIVAIILSGTTMVQADTASAELRASSTTVKPGDTFTVTLHVECQEGINGVIGDKENDGFAFAYDNNKLELLRRKSLGEKVIIDGEEIEPYWNVNSGMSTICIAYGTDTDKIVTEDNVYEWTFKVKSDAEVGSTQITTTDIIICGLEDSETSVNSLSVPIQISNASSQGDPTSDNPTSDDPTGGDPTSDDPTGGDPTSDNPTSDNPTGENPTSDDPTEENPTGGKTTGENTLGKNDKITTTSGKSPDSTTATSPFPNTGSFVIRGFIITSLIAFAVYAYRKYKLYKEL